MEQFLLKLNQVKTLFPQIKWASLPKIRGRVNGRLVCPITSVYYSMTGDLVELRQAFAPAIYERVGLKKEEVFKIISGADRREPRYFGKLTTALRIE